MTLEEQIKSILETTPSARNSDITLTIEIWRKYFKQRIKEIDSEEAIFLKELYDLPREDNVKRIRAKLSQEALERIVNDKTRGDEHYYLPTNDKVARQRQINAEDWLRALGYFRARKQDTKLPEPVGDPTIRIINMGIDGQRFLYADDNVSTQIDLSIDGEWHCDYCGSDNCRHIANVKRLIQKQSAKLINKT